METVFERKLKRAFAKSSASSNIGISVAFFALEQYTVEITYDIQLLEEVGADGNRPVLDCGAGVNGPIAIGPYFPLNISHESSHLQGSLAASAVFAVLAQTVTRLAWLAAKLANRIRNRKIHLPAEETPQFVKVVAQPEQYR